MSMRRLASEDKAGSPTQEILRPELDLHSITGTAHKLETTTCKDGRRSRTVASSVSKLLTEGLTASLSFHGSTRSSSSTHRMICRSPASASSNSTTCSRVGGPQLRLVMAPAKRVKEQRLLPQKCPHNNRVASACPGSGMCSKSAFLSDIELK
eukprot:2141218-Rhodomonas_salina.1